MSAPSPSSTTPSRRRVRTGCLTCRKRRRKCDEGKPKCLNCVRKQLTCRYGSKITFVSPLTSAPKSTTRCGAPAKGSSLPLLTECTEANGSAASVDNDATSSYLLVNLDESAEGPPSTNLPHVRSNSNSVHATHRWSVEPRDAGSSINKTPTEHDPLTNTWTRVHERRDNPSSHLAHQSSPSYGLDLFAAVKDASENRVIQLLRCYREKIGPILDLNTGGGFWSVDILHHSKRSSIIRNAILSVADCFIHGASGFDPLHIDTTELSLGDSPLADDDISTIVLRSLAITLIARPETWLYSLQQHGLEQFDRQVRGQQRQLWDRIYLAARIVAPRDIVANDSSFIDSRNLPGSPIVQSPKSSQLEKALQLLEYSIDLSANQPRNRILFMPTVSSWLHYWNEAQTWYAARTAAMRSLLDLDTTDEATSLHPDNTGFPLIIMSNATAMIANVVHHLTILILLRDIPHFAKPIAAPPDSSTSLHWHALRIAAIAAAAVEHGVWDPLLAVATVKAGEQLSHVTQLTSISSTLQSLCKLSGMSFEADIGILNSSACFDYSEAF